MQSAHESTAHSGPLGRSFQSRSEAAIAFIDVVGYTAMMAKNEERTHALWMSSLDYVIKPAIERVKGELIKSTGDGILAIFESSDDAMSWAISIQEEMSIAGVDKKQSDLRIALRISINFGFIIREPSDVFGDAVNIAARLQQYAPPGGVIISGAAFHRLSDKAKVPVRNLGSLALRNMEIRVPAFLLRFGSVELPERAAPSVGTMPSIAVMPFHHVHGDSEENYLCEGIVDDIIVSLARLRELMVIARGATLMFGRDQPEPREIGRLLGVHYVLTGNLRRSKQGLSISVQLLETQQGQALFAERFESSLDGIFDVQDEIVERVVVGIAPTVRKRELRQALRKRPGTYSAYDYTLRALDIINNINIDTFEKASELLDCAIEEDPSFAMAYAWAARWRSIKVGQGWSKDQISDAKEAERLAKRAIDLDPQNALALATCGHLQSFLFHDYESARLYLKRSREASPSSAYAWSISSATESYLGQGKEAIKMAERSLRLSPKGNELFFFYNFLCLAHYVAGDYDEAVKWGRIAEIEHPLFTSNMRMLSACLSAVGRFEEAREMADRLMAVEPGFGLSHYERVRLPFKPPELRRQFMGHLREAGLPD